MNDLPNIEAMRTRDFDTDLHGPAPILAGVVGAIAQAVHLQKVYKELGL